MRTATDLLVRYAEYHRDQRNISSHFIGVPLIVFAIGLLLARPSFSVAGLSLSPAWIAFAVVATWFLTRGDLALGVAVSVGCGVLLFFAHRMAYAGGVLAGLGAGMGIFVFGWLFQFAGHWYEGRKPAFIDNLIGILVGPMFVVAEVLFMFGWNKPLLAEIERRAGPTGLRDLAKIA